MVRRTPADSARSSNAVVPKTFVCQISARPCERQIVCTMHEHLDAVKDLGCSHRVQVK